MRLWTLHPAYLDAKGLTALWREGLLARQVLLGHTTGYRNHPQLTRFLTHDHPLEAIDSYLLHVAAEAGRRTYKFDQSKLYLGTPITSMSETSGQLLFEWSHLVAKLAKRAPAVLQKHRDVRIPLPNPFFRIVEGTVREWEKHGMSSQAHDGHTAGCPS